VGKPPPDPYRVEVRAVKKGEAVALTRAGQTAQIGAPEDGLYFEVHDPDRPRAFFRPARGLWEELDKLLE
jgi:hypothetical protein